MVKSTTVNLSDVTLELVSPKRNKEVSEFFADVNKPKPPFDASDARKLMSETQKNRLSNEVIAGLVEQVLQRVKVQALAGMSGCIAFDRTTAVSPSQAQAVGKRLTVLGFTFRTDLTSCYVSWDSQ